MSEPVEDLVATVADLKQRVEALERELASLRLTKIDQPLGDRTTVDLGSLWDNASNQERRWSEDDFVESR